MLLQVRREVREEAGVAVGPVHILGSQPWPVGEAMPGCIPEESAWVLLPVHNQGLLDAYAGVTAVTLHTVPG